MADDNNKNDKDELKEVANATAGILSNSVANLVISLVVMMAVAFLGRYFFTTVLGYEKAPEWFGNIAFAFFIGFIFSDPYEAWKEKKLNYRFFGKFGLGTLFGLSLFLFDFGGETSKEAVSAGSEVASEIPGEEEKSISMFDFWPVFLPLLFMPILFATHSLDRFEKTKNLPLKARLKDAALEYLATSGPVIMMAVMGVAALFYWIVAMPFGVLIAFLSMILSGIIIHCLFFYDGTEEPVIDEDYKAPRPKTFGEALSTALDISIKMLPGILFMTGLIWVAMAFWDLETMKFEDGQIEIWALLWPIIKASLIAILIVPGGMMFASVAFATVLAVYAQIKGLGITETKTRADKFSEMLYGGAMGKLFHGSLEDRKE